MVQKLFSLLLCISCLFVVTPVNANETDQYNLPPKPLADIAPEVEAYVAQHIRTAIDKLNAEIDRHERCWRPLPSSAFGTRAGSNVITEVPPKRPSYCGTEKQEQSKLDGLRTPDAVALAVYNQLGAGNIFISDTGKWLNTHKFEHEPSRYVAPYKESIYWTAPIDYATISPTIRVYGVEFGTDKFDHLFQQGYTYYRKYNAARKAGKTDTEALKAVVDYGRFTENTFFGYTVSGVYSNADLAANIAGLKFYQNLANDVKLGSSTMASVLKLRDGRWQVNPTIGTCSSPYYDVCDRTVDVDDHVVKNLTVQRLPNPSPSSGTATPSPKPNPQMPGLPPDEIDFNPPTTAATPITIRQLGAPIPMRHISLSTTHLLEPFITPHLNEELNPSNYLFFLYPVVRSVVQKRACPEWRATFPTATHDSIAARTAALTTWNGLDYGYKQTARQVRLADTCYPEIKGPVAKE